MGDQGTGGVLSPWLRRKRLDAARPYLTGRILDFGCGTGVMTEEPSCRPESYVGVDVDEDSLRVARELRPRFEFSSHLPEDGAFDTIVALAVIEHVADPGGTLSRLGALLAPSGRLVLTTPHPAFRSVHSLGAVVGVFSREASDEHEELLDLESLGALARRADLAVEEYRRFLFGANQLFVLTRRGDGAPGTAVP